jgi:hypothetical protein
MPERWETNLLQIHSLHSLIHALHNIHHAPGNLPHRNGRLYSASHRIDPASQPQQIQPLILFSNCILCIDFCDVAVALLDRLFVIFCQSMAPRAGQIRRVERTHLLQLVFLSLLILAGFRCLAVQLLRRELFE